MSVLELGATGLRVDELHVRPSTLDDVATIAPILTDEATGGEAGMPRMTHDELRAFIRDELPGLRARGVLIPFLVTDESDALLGGVSLQRFDPPRQRIEIGYWLLPEARGRGVVTRVVRALADAVFAAGVMRVEAVVRPENAASIRVLERVGFTREGTLRSLLRYRDGRADAHLYSLLPGE